MATTVHNSPPAGACSDVDADISGRGLCLLCADFERQVLNPWTKDSESVTFRHHQYFGEVTAAAAAGCRLCAVLEQGYLCSNSTSDTTDGPVVQKAMIEETRKRLLRRDQCEAQWKQDGWFRCRQQVGSFRHMKDDEIATQGLFDRFQLFIFPEKFQTMSATGFQPWLGLARLSYARTYENPDFEETEAQFMVCTTSDDAALLTGNFCGREISQPFNAALAKDWLESCLRSHRCNSTMTALSTEMPSRLVTIEGNAGGLRARLSETTKDTKTEHYAALSYRWSKNKSHITLRNYVDAYANDIPLDTLPATIRDAIHISHAPGIRHIWIDCLCIIQDSLRDWELECNEMANIFANATVTLAASSATDAEYGLLRFRNSSSSSSHCVLTFRDTSGLPSGQVKVTYNHNLYHGTGEHLGPLLQTPLDERGWTLQERLVSPRVLFIEDEKMWWECTSCLLVESSHVCIPVFTKVWGNLRIVKQPLLELSPIQIYRWWLIAVTDFCQRQLTYPNDALPAVAGLAGVVSRVTSDTYLAGLWQGDLAKGLMWTTHLLDFDQGDYQPDLSAPSWSWARAERRVCWATNLWDSDDEVQSFVSFVSANIQTAGANMFGSVVPGCVLTIEAPSRPAMIYRERVRFNFLLFKMVWKTTYDWDRGITIALDRDSLDSRHDDQDELSVLAVMISNSFSAGRTEKRSHGLILQLADGGVNYRRIGIITHDEYELDLEDHRYGANDTTRAEHFFKDAKIRTISII